MLGVAMAAKPARCAEVTPFAESSKVTQDNAAKPNRCSATRNTSGLLSSNSLPRDNHRKQSFAEGSKRTPKQTIHV